MSFSQARGRKLVYSRSAGCCEICGQTRATEWHHRRNRSQGGTWAPSNGLHVCHQCHVMVTDTQGNRALYERNGWIVKGHTVFEPHEIPVLITMAWDWHKVLAYLDDDGERRIVDPEDDMIGDAA